MYRRDIPPIFLHIAKIRITPYYIMSRSIFYGIKLGYLKKEYIRIIKRLYEK